MGFDDSIIYILLCAGLIIIVILLVVGSKIAAKQKEIVRRTSVKLSTISKIGAKYDFHNIEHNKVFQKLLNSKSQFDNYKVSKLMEEVVLTYWDSLVLSEKYAKQNRAKYARYLAEIQSIPNYTTLEFTKINKVKYDKYVQFENELFEEYILRPVTEIEYTFVKRYSSPQGRNNYSYQEIVSFDDIKATKQRIETKKQYKESKEYQRSIMTPKLRYSVLQRDGFRCVLCGRDADQGVTLEVDHIVPISKGGLTEYNNLRTLCRECNRGKAGSYNPRGMN